MSFHTKLECSRCSTVFAADRLRNLCTNCGSPLLARYALDEIGHQLSKTSLLDRPADMWRYLEVLPVEKEEEIVSLGEGFTPLVPLPRLGARLGLPDLLMKDESVNPTGSFKARGISAAVSMAKKFGATDLCMPTAGNAGGALAAYAARGRLHAHVFMPGDTPSANVLEVEMCGAYAEKVDGVITDAARVMNERREGKDWYDISTLKEPYRIEGKKTMGYEIAEQLSWQLPDVILYPTGGGTGLIGMWKAFDEMEAMGWIDSIRPRMVSVQAEGCAPIVRAFEAGAESAEPWENPHTMSSGIRVPGAVGDFIMLRTLRESHGTAVAVSDEESYQALLSVGREEGAFICPEGAACFAALNKLVDNSWISPTDTVVVFNTGAGSKYIDTLKAYAESRGARGD